MDFNICKAEVCSLFMFVLLLKLFMGCFKNPPKGSHGSGIICVLITQLNLCSWLLGQSLEPRGQAPQLAYSNLAPSHTALRANKLFIYSVNSACPGEFKHGDSFCEARLFRNMGKENQQKLNALD